MGVPDQERPVPELACLTVQYRDDRGRRRTVRVWADPGRGYRGDFRAFADAGGGREALVPPGEHWATADPVLAEDLAKRRIAALLARRQARRDGKPLEDPRLADYRETHLAEKATRRIKASTIARDRYSLDRVLAVLGPDLRLSALDVDRLRAFVRQRRAAGR